jgi:hypothetical protein
MRILQTIIQKLACIAVLAGGAALAIFSVSGLYEAIVTQLPEPRPLLRIAIGCVAAALGIFALLPLGGGRRRSRELRFEGDSGAVTAQLDSIAASLNKTFNALPVVKKGTIRLTPTKAADKANVHADVQILIPAGSSLRETSTQLQVYLKELACSRIGGEEIENVSVNVTKAETGDQPSVDMKASPAQVEVATPEPYAVPEPEPLTIEEDLPSPESETPISEDLVTYEESLQAVEEEERSLTGQSGDEPEPEMSVPWDAEDISPEPVPVDDEPDSETSPLEDQAEPYTESPVGDDTSFDSLADEQLATEEDEERPSSGGV